MSLVLSAYRCKTCTIFASRDAERTGSSPAGLGRIEGAVTVRARRAGARSAKTGRQFDGAKCIPSGHDSDAMARAVLRRQRWVSSAEHRILQTAELVRLLTVSRHFTSANRLGSTNGFSCPAGGGRRVGERGRESKRENESNTETRSSRRTRRAGHVGMILGPSAEPTP